MVRAPRVGMPRALSAGWERVLDDYRPLELVPRKRHSAATVVSHSHRPDRLFAWPAVGGTVVPVQKGDGGFGWTLTKGVHHSQAGFGWLFEKKNAPICQKIRLQSLLLKPSFFSLFYTPIWFIERPTSIAPGGAPASTRHKSFLPRFTLPSERVELAVCSVPFV